MFPILRKSLIPHLNHIKCIYAIMAVSETALLCTYMGEIRSNWCHTNLPELNLLCLLSPVSRLILNLWAPSFQGAAPGVLDGFQTVPKMRSRQLSADFVVWLNQTDEGEQ